MPHVSVVDDSAPEPELFRVCRAVVDSHRIGKDEAFGMTTSLPSLVVTMVARAWISDTFPSIPVTLIRSPNRKGSCSNKRSHDLGATFRWLP